MDKWGHGDFRSQATEVAYRAALYRLQDEVSNRDPSYINPPVDEKLPPGTRECPECFGSEGKWVGREWILCLMCHGLGWAKL